jgi:hypothetical protein
LNEIACNQDLTPAQEKRRDEMEARYAELAASFGLFTEFQRDPRGAALKLHDTRDEIDSNMGVVL